MKKVLLYVLVMFTFQAIAQSTNFAVLNNYRILVDTENSINVNANSGILKKTEALQNPSFKWSDYSPFVFLFQSKTVDPKVELGKEPVTKLTLVIEIQLLDLLTGKSHGKKVYTAKGKSVDEEGACKDALKSIQFNIEDLQKMATDHMNSSKNSNENCASILQNFNQLKDRGMESQALLYAGDSYVLSKRNCRDLEEVFLKTYFEYAKVHCEFYHNFMINNFNEMDDKLKKKTYQSLLLLGICNLQDENELLSANNHSISSYKSEVSSKTPDFDSEKVTEYAQKISNIVWETNLVKDQPMFRIDELQWAKDLISNQQ